jgi:hypothetical protein
MAGPAADHRVGARRAGPVADRHGHAHQPAHLEGLADEVADLAQVERLEQVVVAAELGRLDRLVDGAGGGDEDDRHRRVAVAQPAE